MFKRFFSKMLGKGKEKGQGGEAESVGSPTTSDKNEMTDTVGNSPERIAMIDYEFDFSINLGGGKGWPNNVTNVVYHKMQGLVVAGTENGTIYVYGDGFQYMLPSSIIGSNEISIIVPVQNDKVLIAYGNNSLTLFDLPYLNTVYSLHESWLGRKAGDITYIHYDDAMQGNFVYVGTSSGYVLVLEMSQSSLRECDYLITLNDVGINADVMAVSSIEMYPEVHLLLNLFFTSDTNAFYYFCYSYNRTKNTLQFHMMVLPNRKEQLSSSIW